MDITFRPIDQWPDGWLDREREGHRRTSPFKVGYPDTINDLAIEVDAYGATTAHVQLDVTTAQLRRDGMLRADTKVTHPGVILTVVNPQRTVVLATDRFRADWRRMEDWHCNLRACFLGLVDLRRMERYGLNGGDAQYAGFAASGAGSPTALGAGMSREEARNVLVDAAGWDMNADVVTPEQVQAAYRDAARLYHPDRSDGDARAMARINQARQVLEAHAR